MVNFLNSLNNPQFNYEMFFEVLRDFRKGGISPDNYEDFLYCIKTLPPINKRKPKDFSVFDKFNFNDISSDDFSLMMRELNHRCIEMSKFCWHPEASSRNCSTDSKGNIIISAAHSIQNNGILDKISENGHVVGYALDKRGF